MPSILYTKLRPPILGTRLINRKRIFAPITEKILRRETLLTLVVAPAGFGKTTFLAQWRQDLIPHGVAVVWLSMDEADNNLARFHQHLDFALQEQINQSKIGGGLALERGIPNSPATDFLNVMAGADRNFVVMLDDYHLISNPRVHKAVEYLIRFSPSNTHYSLASRAALPLELGQIKARGLANTVGSDLLRFGEEDLSHLIENGFISGLSHEEIFDLNEAMEGWPIGLQLAAVSGKTSSDIEQLRHVSKDTLGMLHEFIEESVFSKLPKDEQLFLLDISVVDEVSPSLANALRGHDDSESFITKICDKNLFLFFVDAENEWFRFHAVFLDFLERRLARLMPDRRKLLHLRASRWFEDHDRTTEAARHALRAKYFDRAAVLVDKCGRQLLHEGHQELFIDFVEELPPDLRDRYANVVYLRAWAHLLVGEIEKARCVADKAESLIAEMHKNKNEGQYDFDQINALEDEMESLRLILQLSVDAHWADIKKAREIEGHRRSKLTFSAGMASYGQALIYLRRDEILKATGALEKAKRQFLEDRSINSFSTVTYLQGHILRDQGRLKDILRLCEEAEKTAARLEESDTPALEPVHILLAQYELEQSNLSEGRAHLRLAERLNAQSLRADWKILIKLCNVAFDLRENRYDRALSTIEEAESLSRECRSLLPFSVQNIDVRIVKANALIRVGDIQESFKLLEGLEAPLGAISPPPGLNCCYRDWPLYLCFVRYLLAAGFSDRAARWIRTLLTEVRGSGLDGIELRLNILLADATLKTKGPLAAYKVLREVLANAEERAYLTTLVDEGQDLAELVEGLRRGRSEPHPALPLKPSNRFLDRFLEVTGRSVPMETDCQRSLEWRQFGDNEISLTGTERKVLDLAAAGLTTSEIARELGIRNTTVKWHFQNVFSKLGVHSRMQAIALSRKLALVR